MEKEDALTKTTIDRLGSLTDHRARLRPSLPALTGTSLLACTVMLAAIPASAQYKQVNLVSDKAGLALHTDGNLLDPWGMAALPGGAMSSPMPSAVL